jgi:putative addiction module component (TIGR02574 family)
MRKLQVSKFLQLSLSERIQLVEDLWDSIASAPESIDLTEDQRKELDRRLEAYHKHPTAGSPWEMLKKSLRKKAA